MTSSTEQPRIEHMSLSVVRVMLRLCFMASSVPLLKEYLVISVYVVTPFFIVSHKGSKVINRMSSRHEQLPTQTISESLLLSTFKAMEPTKYM